MRTKRILLAALVLVVVLYATSRVAAQGTEGEAAYTSQPYRVHLPTLLRGWSVCGRPLVMLNPPDGAMLDTLLPRLEWDASGTPLITRTRFEVARDAGFTNLYTQGWTLYWEEPVQFFDAWDNWPTATTFYWRIAATCGEVECPFSGARSFTTGSGGIILPGPQLVSPASGSVAAGTDIDFQWSPVPGAVEYIVAWRKVGEAWPIRSRTADTQMDWIHLDPNSTYEWWVVARNDYAWGQESTHWQITTGGETALATAAPEGSRITVSSADGTSELATDGVTLYCEFPPWPTHALEKIP